MKRRRLISIFALTALLCSTGLFAAGAPLQHGFSVKQYHDFHEVLHPLEHEALPKGDFPRIRAGSKKLIMHGKRIVRLGVPRGTRAEDLTEFKKGLRKFNQALAKFGADAKSGTDEQLKTSYSAVHDSFEMLAGMLPKVKRT